MSSAAVPPACPAGSVRRTGSRKELIRGRPRGRESKQEMTALIPRPYRPEAARPDGKVLAPASLHVSAGPCRPSVHGNVLPSPRPGSPGPWKNGLACPSPRAAQLPAARQRYTACIGKANRSAKPASRTNRQERHCSPRAALRAADDPALSPCLIRPGRERPSPTGDPAVCAGATGARRRSGGREPDRVCIRAPVRRA